MKSTGLKFFSQLLVKKTKNNTDPFLLAKRRRIRLHDLKVIEDRLNPKIPRKCRDCPLFIIDKYKKLCDVCFFLNQKKSKMKSLKKNKAKYQEYRKKWRKDNAHLVKLATQAWRKKNPETNRKYALEYYYKRKALNGK